MLGKTCLTGILEFEELKQMFSYTCSAGLSGGEMFDTTKWNNQSIKPGKNFFSVKVFYINGVSGNISSGAQP